MSTSLWITSSTEATSASVTAPERGMRRSAWSRHRRATTGWSGEKPWSSSWQPLCRRPTTSSATRAAAVAVSVEAAAPGVSTVTVGGRGVEGLDVRGGQFFNWRFLDAPGWTRANPYSLSAAPDGRTLRFTAAHVGDGSARLAGLRPGTRVLVEGPYGRLHAGVGTRSKVLLLASGIGVTPMRAILEELPIGTDVTLVHRVRRRSEAVLGDELRALAAARGARLVTIEGTRVTTRSSWLRFGPLKL